MLCEEGMTIAKARSALLVPQSTKQATLAKAQSNRLITSPILAKIGIKQGILEPFFPLVLSAPITNLSFFA
jgi:hypothetical protein